MHSQLKLEIMSSLAKDTRINHMEDLIVKLGIYPNDVDVGKENIKNSNVDIQALRKKLKLPTIEHSQVQQVEEI